MCISSKEKFDDTKVVIRRTYMTSSQYTKGAISEAVIFNVKYSICSLALLFYSSLWVWLFCVHVSLIWADTSSQPYGISLIGLYPKPETRFLTPYVVDVLCSILFKVRCWHRWYGWHSLFKHFLFHNEMLWIFKLYQWFHWNAHFSYRLIWKYKLSIEFFFCWKDCKCKNVMHSKKYSISKSENQPLLYKCYLLGLV